MRDTLFRFAFVLRNVQRLNSYGLDSNSGSWGDSFSSHGAHMHGNPDHPNYGAIFVTMVLEVLSSPHRRSQSPFSPSSPAFRKQLHGHDELGSCSTIFERHRFLLTTLALLAFLCAIYLYFAVTLGASVGSCSEMTGKQRALCHLEQAKSSVSHVGKMKFF